MAGSTWKTLLRPLLFLSLFSSTIGKSSSSSNHHHQSTIRCKMAPAAAAERQITMRAGAAFKIALFADLHFGEDAWTNWGPLQDIHSVNV
ncbi:putative inactive purple acid phosphatase, partial [Trifolium medium]|nr:putative inactive purple acid phosphatase [Trifolium medium]